MRTVGVSSYDSLQLKFQRRYHKGLQFLVSYTLSEAKTNAGDSLSGGGVGGLRAPDVVGWDLENDIGLSGFHTRHALVVSGNYDLPVQGRDLRRLAHQLGGVVLQRPGADDQLHAGDGLRHRLLRARRRRSVCRQPRRDQFYNPAAFANPAPVATIGQTDFSPLGGPRSQVTGPPLRQLDMGVARQFGLWGQSKAEFRVEVVQPDQHAGVQPAGVAELRRRAQLREHHQHAQHAAADPGRLEVLLVA